MQADWTVAEDGYHKETLLVETPTKKILGRVYGSKYDHKWTAWAHVTGPGETWIGQFVEQHAAEDFLYRWIRSELEKGEQKG